MGVLEHVWLCVVVCVCVLCPLLRLLRDAGVPRDLGPLFIVHGSLGRLIDRMAGEVNPAIVAVRVTMAMARFLERNARYETI